MNTINQFRLEGAPPPWSVTGIDGFILSALARTEREGSKLPADFFATFCPWGERNAAFHNASEMSDVYEPPFRLVHFTSCGRPFLVAILTGADAEERQRKAMKYLPWSEHYRGRLEGNGVVLTFIDETEDLDIEPPGSLGERSLRQLFESGEILDF